MNIWKRLLQALLGLLLAAGCAVFVSTWVFPEERSLLFSFSHFRLCVSGVGAALSLLTVLAFADGWIHAGRKADPEGGGLPRLMNALGLGLLPGIAVWKIFEEKTLLAEGAALPAEMVSLPVFTVNGCWAPCRIEAVLALVLFAAVILWLILRKSPLPENGDLLGVCLALWGALRIGTEPVRIHQIRLLGDFRIVGWLAAAAMALPLVFWTVRAFRQKRNTGYAAACIPVFILSIAGIMLIVNNAFRVDLFAARLILFICLQLLSLKAVLCMGRVTRKFI